MFNRDISLLVALVFSKKLKANTLLKKKPFTGIKFYDALTASGLRALRFRKEIPNSLINKVIGCDFSKSAIETFRRNLILNGLENDPKMEIK